MKRPNAIPSSPQPAIKKFVGAGLQRLPGESVFDNPSMNRTATMSKVDMIPIIEV